MTPSSLTDASRCPSCDAEIAQNAVLCIDCGFHLEKRTHLVTSDFATNDTACDSCGTRILQKTHDRNGGLCGRCVKPKPTTWIQKKAQAIVGAIVFFIGLGTGGVFIFKGTQSLSGAIFLVVANGFLVLWAAYGFRRARDNGKFLGAEPDMFLVMIAIGYVAGIAVGALLPLYDYLFPLEK